MKATIKGFVLPWIFAYPDIPALRIFLVLGTSTITLTYPALSLEIGSLSIFVLVDSVEATGSIETTFPIIGSLG